MFENTANIPSIDGKWCTQCDSVMISQLRQYLGSCANSGLKNVSHVEAFLFICNILVADQSCYFVCRLCKHCCRNFNNVHCFRTIFPNRNSAFASFCIACPSPWNMRIREIVLLPNAAVVAARLIQMGSIQNSAVTLNSRNDMISIHQMSVRTNECKITLILSDYIMNGFIMSGIMIMTATPLNNSTQSFDV